MTEHDPLEPHDDDVLALLEGAKDVPELPSATKDALFASIVARLPVPPTPGGGDQGGAGSPPPASPPPASPPVASGLGARALAALATTFVLGTGAGILIDRAMLRPPTSTVAVARTAAPLATPEVALATGPATVLVDSLPSATTPPAAPPAPRAPRAAEAPLPGPSSRGLAAERGLLDVARAALARGAPDEALAAAERHGREYRDGVLAEEREALAIKALVALGRRAEATTRADAFERRYPNALGLPAVRAALEER